ncbi:MAG: 7-carboxy-7-deazaguanine synthase QueE [Armatimonadetes bacterium]|nr:7-carboxy-7-deazaguanine synthase QueE [Armatimonadota bacterium]
MKLRVAEVFASLQGEGRFVGVPSAFVRVSGCNLRCVWCDTPYASWSPEGPTLEVEKIARQVVEIGTRHVVITGGEPMLFEGTVELAAMLKEAGHMITVETAGTIYRDLDCDLMSISPKLAHSTPEGEWRDRHEAARLNVEVLSQLAHAYDCQLKFVVDPDHVDADVDEIEDLLGRLPEVSPEQVILMSEGREAARLHAGAKLLAPVCMQKGWRLTPRLQIDLYGDTRGT